MTARVLIPMPKVPPFRSRLEWALSHDGDLTEAGYASAMEEDTAARRVALLEVSREMDRRNFPDGY